MAYITLAPPAGLYRSGTTYQAKGRWYDANLVRFQQGQVKPIRGWQLRSDASAFSGAARCLLSWRDNSNNRWIAVGTHSHLYIQDEAGANHDVTPIRKTSTLAANSFATTSGQTAVVVTDNAHGANVGDTVIVASATAVGGVVAGDLNGSQTVTAATTNTWTFQAAHAATSTATGGGTPALSYEITPGRADATQNLGYGGGLYGVGYYGVPRANTSAYLPATVWSLEPWGEYLVGCSDTDGKIYQWSLSTSTHAATVTNAPSGCAGIVVTQEGFLFALGQSSHSRRVAWSDQQDNTVWTPSATNQAGDYDLPTIGTLMCGKALPAGALLFTDVDVWRASYIGTPLVYGFERVGSGCGPISKGAVATHDSAAAWLSPGPNFWYFDGQTVQALDCEVIDFVSDINVNQRSKVTAVHVAVAGELWWFFPSSGSNENDSYVVWAYRESQRLQRNVWSFGRLARTGGSGKVVFDNPLMIDPAGLLYEHETGLNFGGATPYIESGPVEIGQGDYMGEIQRIVPDEVQDGNLTATLYGRIWPDGAEFSSAALSLTSPTDTLFQAREVRIRFTQAASTDWRIGATRLDVVRGDPI